MIGVMIIVCGLINVWATDASVFILEFFRLNNFPILNKEH